jgi:hypothetical protein
MQTGQEIGEEAATAEASQRRSEAAIISIATSAKIRPAPGATVNCEWG